MNPSVKLLVIEPRTGYVSYFVGRTCLRIVQFEDPDSIAQDRPWLENFRLTGCVGEHTAPEAA